MGTVFRVEVPRIPMQDRNAVLHGDGLFIGTTAERYAYRVLKP